MIDNLGPPSQVGFVVPNVDEAVRTWWHQYGVGPWRIWNFVSETITDATVDGIAAEYAMRIALSKWQDLDVELIEPLDELSIYARSLSAHDGKAHLHHLRCRPVDYDQAVDDFRARGHDPIMTGNIAGGIFSYFGTEDDVGTVIEISKVPEVHQLPEGEEVYPPPD
jgi:methylmalonyl-CoA/ethylmalonyl-CoA epimerase